MTLFTIFLLPCPSRKFHPSLFCLHLAEQSATLSSPIIGSFLEPSAVFYADFLNSLPSHSISSGFSIDAFDPNCPCASMTMSARTPKARSINLQNTQPPFRSNELLAHATNCLPVLVDYSIFVGGQNPHRGSPATYHTFGVVFSS